METSENKDIEKVEDSSVASNMEEKEILEDSHEDANVSAELAELDEEENFDDADLDKIHTRLKEIIQNNALKQYRKSFINARARYKEIFEEEKGKVLNRFLEGGEKEEDFKFNITPELSQVKEIIHEFQDRLTEIRRKEEAELQSNLLAKQDILNELKDLISNESDIKKAFEVFHELRNRWKGIGAVPGQHASELWNNYKFFSDKFYEFVEINKELFEVELKKNEKAKEQLIKSVEGLLDMPSIQNSIAALHTIQKEWRELGPVHRDKNEEIWNRFKAAVDKVYQRRDEYLKERDVRRKENLVKKTDLCEKTEAIAELEYDQLKGWKEKEKELKQIEEDWKKIGRVPTKFNDSIWERFKSARKAFYRKKYDLLKVVKGELQENYKLKEKLCEAAEALKDNTDWKNTTQKLIKLQGDWKKIGPVERKKSDEIWKRFRAACDHFFNAKEAYHAGQSDREKENLEKKKVLLKELKSYKTVESLDENLEFIRGHRSKWNEAGFVPIGEKKKIEKEYDKAVDSILEKLDVDKDKKFRIDYKIKLEGILQSPNAEKALKDERSFVGNRLRKLQEEVAQLENNLSFFGFNKGDKVDAMKKTYTDKIERLQTEIQQLEDKKLQLKTAFKQLKEN